MSALHCMAAKRAYEIHLTEVDIGKAIADAQPELGRVKLTKLYEKIDSHHVTIKNLGDQVQSLEKQLQKTKDNSAKLSNCEELKYYQGRIDIPASNGEDNDEDPMRLPTIPEEIPQCIPLHPPTRLAHSMSKLTKNTGKSILEAGIPAIGGIRTSTKQNRVIADPPASITGVLPKPLGKVKAERWDQPALQVVSDWVMESDVHDSEMRWFYIEGRALQLHEWSLDHTVVIFHIDEYARSLPGLPKNFVARHNDPDWMMNVIQTFNVNPSEIP
ncbi:hypothetical protein M422DRAFT_254175 [Sphaerobolus stellatus SS14]|uniref:Uncharacterized protein n=1 Tax=Sphaerobolus stellatus (strain SS14) TaxID=990650 RepID=A0A0C9VWK0_SPHS4|nr:hypothetical protein M422DRAFT_254175 [Sphaerobolus stellatus SS14]